jgi:riboflavin kinase/FMN adenylyltransferase
MNVCFDLRKVDYFPFEQPVVTVGTFDGVHRGHQRIIKKLVGKAKRKKKKSVLVTFEPHPQSVVAPKSAPKILTTLEEKLFLLEKLGIDETLVLNFDKELSGYSAEEFIQKILIDKLNIGDLVIGYDHAFGRNREGRKELLRKASQKYGFGLETVLPVKNDDLPIKSTRIRKELLNGDFTKAIHMLGHSYPIYGAKIPGSGLGKKMGYPTMNLAVSEKKLLPQDGVYTSLVQIENSLYSGMFYSGKSFIFPNKGRSLEVNVFDYRPKNDVKKVGVFLLDRIRSNEKFENIDALKEQLRDDERKAKMFLSRKGGILAFSKT